jgi:hypothetical protein
LGFWQHRRAHGIGQLRRLGKLLKTGLGRSQLLDRLGGGLKPFERYAAISGSQSGFDGPRLRPRMNRSSRVQRQSLRNRQARSRFGSHLWNLRNLFKRCNKRDTGYLEFSGVCRRRTHHPEINETRLR